MEIIDTKPSGFVKYAGFTVRFFAHLIDIIAIGIARSIMALVFGFSIWEPRVDIIWFGSIFGLVYFVVMESSKYQGTIGKMVLNLKVIDAEGNRLTASKSLIRNLSKIISAFILLIGFIMVAFNEKKRGLHDMIAGT
ncbi:MAG: RDD family protein, partial [Chitinophagales bacterium]